VKITFRCTAILLIRLRVDRAKMKRKDGQAKDAGPGKRCEVGGRDIFDRSCWGLRVLFQAVRRDIEKALSASLRVLIL
jgi:hypothetical protein